MSSDEDAMKAMNTAVEFAASGAPHPDADLGVKVPMEMTVDTETGEARWVTAEEFLDRGFNELVEMGMERRDIAALRNAVLNRMARREYEANPIKIGKDDSGNLRFATIESKEYSLANRESAEAEIREFLTESKYIPEYHDEIVELMFTTRTNEEPPVIPTNISLYGRPSDEIDPNETSDIITAYEDHMMENWGI